MALSGARSRGVVLMVVTLVLALSALGLLYGGGLLLLTGGSPFYLLAGALLGACAVLLWRGSRLALWAYAALIAAASGWALRESGLDAWAMAPRLGFFDALGLALFLPAVRRHLTRGPAFGPLAGYLLLGLIVAVPGAALVFGSASSFATGPSLTTSAPAADSDDWTDYGGSPAGQRYTGLSQITPENVGKLRPAWRYSFHEAQPTNLQIAPLKIGQVVYACNSTNVLVALDAASGRQLWRHDPRVDLSMSANRACRALGYYRAPGLSGVCAARILESTVDARLIAVDAATGQSCPGFGKDGEISLLEGLGPPQRGYYWVNGGPTIARGRVVLGANVIDNQKWGEPSGVIRAFDAVTGKLVWAYDVGAPERIGAPPPGGHYTLATPNNWAQMAYDDRLGLVYVPTGNATPDYYGALRRPIDDEISSSLMALDIETGRRKWIFQTTHHDLWDYDLGSQPVLFDLPTAHGPVPAVIQASKRGELFVLDRATGKPLTAVTERPVSSAGAAPGERVSPTQPFSTGMPSLAGKPLTEADLWGLTPFDQLWCRITFRKTRYAGPLTPPGITPSLEYPGFLGGVDWGSVSVDPARNMLVAVSSYLANYVRLVPRADADRQGAFPMGHGREGMAALIGINAQYGTPYGVESHPFLSPLQVPCQQSPWSRISGIDLASRKIVWSRPLGLARDNGPLGIVSHLPLTMGVPALGGVLLTKTGLAFVGASTDHRFRAFSSETGRLLWSTDLPASGIAPVVSYRDPVDGRQFIVIAAGGHRSLGARGGDSIVAYALPR